MNLNRSLGELGAGLSASQQTRLTVLDHVRRITVGEDVVLEDLLAMCAWVLDGDTSVARQVADDTHRRYGENDDSSDAVRYRPGKRLAPVDPVPGR